MEINGKEFLRNVSIEQEKAELEERRRKLDKQKRESLRQTTPEYSKDDEPVYVNISSQADQPPLSTPLEKEKIFDLKLNDDNNKNNKKKYIILGFSLIILFILTIVLIRVLSNNDQEKKLTQTVEPTQTITKDKVLDKIDEQKVVKPKEPIKEIVIPEPKIEKKDIMLPEIIKEELPEIKKETPKPKITKIEKKDPLEIEKKKVINKPKPKPKAKVTPKPKAKPVVKHKPKPKAQPKAKIYSQPKRKIVLPPAKETNFTKKKHTKVKGYYIQIGAFSKKPNNKLLKSIERKGYRYAVYPIKIKGKIYNKVLIGAYPTKGLALKVISRVKKDFHNPNAYILKF